MINAQLQNTVNSNRLLNNLAQNLGVDHINTGSNLKKMTDAYISENLIFTSAVDTAVGNMFLGSANATSIELAGSQVGVYRKNYQSISFNTSENVANISMNALTNIVVAGTTPIVPFKKGDVILVANQFNLQFKEDVILTNNVTPTNIAATITCINTANSFIISENSIFKLSPRHIDINTVNQTFSLTFTKSLGISVVQETLQDYTTRLYETTYTAANGANSLISTIAKEVPYVSFLESENIESGRSVQNVYIYTNTLISNGVDTNIADIILPLIETSVINRALPGTFINCMPATPINMSIIINSNMLPRVTPPQSVLNNIVNTFNILYSTKRGITYYGDVISYINNVLSSYNITSEAYSIYIVSPVLKQTLTITDLVSTPIDIPLGRFLRIDNLTVS